MIWLEPGLARAGPGRNARGPLAPEWMAAGGTAGSGYGGPRACSWRSSARAHPEAKFRGLVVTVFKRRANARCFASAGIFRGKVQSATRRSEAHAPLGEKRTLLSPGPRRQRASVRMLNGAHTAARSISHRNVGAAVDESAAGLRA